MQSSHERNHRHGATLRRVLERLQLATKLTRAELLFFALYPTTIGLGQLLLMLGSAAQENNYYTNKHNLLNVLFVKKGWLWTVILYVYYTLQHRARSLFLPFIRLSLATLWWYCFTQSFFGLPLMDRVFLWTGGVCTYDAMQYGTLEYISSALCRRVSGTWNGGHDPSGHVFLLVLSSVVLGFEVLESHVQSEITHLSEQYSRIQAKHLTAKDRIKHILLLLISSSTFLVFALLSLWWWMLLITSIHFHSFAEKITGLIAAALGVLIYIIPRFYSH